MAQSLGLALSGGGVRGLAHIGVLQALEENGIYPQNLSGTSAGALVSVLYAAGYSPADILTIFKESSLTRLFKMGMPTNGLTDNRYLIEVLKEHLDEDRFEALPRRLHISITNLSTGQNEIRSEGELFRVVAASAAIPILFQAWDIEGDMYADGGVLNNLPIEPLLGKSSPIVGVNVTPIFRKGELDNILDAGYRTFDLVMWANVAHRLRQCDVVIEPATQDYSLFDLKSADAIYQLGYEAAQAEMLDILRKLDPKGQVPYQQPLRRPLPGTESAPEREAEDENRDYTDRVGDFFRQMKARFGN